MQEFRPAPSVSVVQRNRTQSSSAALAGSSASTSSQPPPPPLDTFIPPPASEWADPFSPEAVYDSLKNNNRFDAMRNGHQEDAEEFLGFFLDTLHDEILILIDRAEKREEKEGAASKEGEVGEDWLEVGSKGRTATTRTVRYLSRYSVDILAEEGELTSLAGSIDGDEGIADYENIWRSDSISAEMSESEGFDYVGALSEVTT